MTDLVEASLEVAAERRGDISSDIYAAYFSRCPGSEALMSHLDDLVRGKMLEEVFRLILLPDYDDEQQYLTFEVDNHKRAYNVKPEMYGNLLSAVRDTVREAAGPDWDDATASAWDTRLNLLVSEIERRL